MIIMIIMIIMMLLMIKKRTCDSTPQPGEDDGEDDGDNDSDNDDNVDDDDKKKQPAIAPPSLVKPLSQEKKPSAVTLLLSS